MLNNSFKNVFSKQYVLFMNKKFYRIFNVLAVLFTLTLISCSKSSSSGPGGSGSTGTGGGSTDTVPANITDMRGGTSGITITPYPGFPTISQLIPLLAVGYYYIPLGGMDTLSFVIQADSNNGANVGVAGETSESGPDYFTSGDSLQFFETQIKAVGSLGDTELVYYTKDLAKGYTLTSTDTTNFSDAYSQTQVYYSGLPSNTGYNLFDIESYIAFRIKNSMGYRYGWMLAASDPAAGQLLSIYEIAFDKNYNELIAIGEYK
jgi:hypothetical protein